MVQTQTSFYFSLWGQTGGLVDVLDVATESEEGLANGFFLKSKRASAPAAMKEEMKGDASMPGKPPLVEAKIRKVF